MAHVQKFSKSSAAKILGHCEREKNEKNEYLKYKSKSDIDPDKTNLNIKLKFDDGLKAHERLKKRLSEVYVLNRKDVNVMCDWVVTLPKSLVDDKEKTNLFFKESTDFLKKRYGEENAVSANIHFDETTPHLHYCFVPVVYDSKKKKKKVSAKELLNKKELSTFHSDFGNYIETSIGLDQKLVHNGITTENGGNKSISELKNLQSDIQGLMVDKNSLQVEIKAYKDNVDTLKDQHALILEESTLALYKRFAKVFKKNIEKSPKKTKVTIQSLQIDKSIKLNLLKSIKEIAKNLEI